jgi:hypothetical protein
MITRVTLEHSEADLAVIAQQIGSKARRAKRKEVVEWVNRVCAEALGRREELQLEAEPQQAAVRAPVMKVKATGSLLRVIADMGGAYILDDGEVYDADDVEAWP